MIHHVKCIEPFYSVVKSGKKTFELRKNDRLYMEGDIIELMQFIDGELTGKFFYVEIGYILEDFTGLTKGYCIMGVKRLGCGKPQEETK